MAAQTAPAAPTPRTHLVWAVLVTCLCFLPLGLIAVGFAWRTSVLIGRGDLDQARRSSRAAKGWAITALIVGIVVDIVLLGALALLGAFGT